MRVARITVADKIEQLMPLVREHWQEVAVNKRVMNLKPSVEQYRELEAKGLVIGFATYDGLRIVGYAVTFLCRSHIHYADLCYAVNDVLFVSKEHRRGKAGLLLIRETEAAAKEQGAQLMLWHAKQGTAFQALLARRGYGVQDIIFSKEL